MTLLGENRNRMKIIDVSKILYRIGAIKFGSFKLTSGKLSPYYVDLRLIPSFPEAFHRVSEILIEFIKEELGTSEVDKIA
ncbi:MAG: hypothetical protein QXL67_03900, partial [Candidatus Bathyarchaeia archaeon]